MKTQNAKWMSWVRRASSLVLIFAMTFGLAGQASARILFEDDEYFGVQSSGITLDENNNVFPGATATLAVQNVTVNASAVGTGGNAQTVTIGLADTNDSTCTVTGGTGTGAITLTCDDGTTSGLAADTSDIQGAINAEALFTASGGDATAANTLATTNLAGGEDGETIDVQFGNDGTDASFSYDTTTQDVEFSSSGSDFVIGSGTGMDLSASDKVRIREEAFTAYTGVGSAPSCSEVGEIALDTNTSAIYVCTNSTTDTWKSADNNPADGSSDSQTLRWDAATGAWEANSNLLVDDAVPSVTVANGTSFTANGAVTIGDGGDAFDINATTANWDLSSIDLDTTGAITINSAAGAGNDITIGAGDQLIFDDNILTTPVYLNVNETALSTNYTANGIIDALNDFQSLTDGAEGATFVATDASDFTNVTPAGNTVQDVLEALDIGIGTATQNFDDVYDESQSDGNLTMEIDNGTLNYNITTADSFAIQDGGTNIGEFTGAGAVLFDPTSGQNFDVTTLGAGDVVITSADDVDINSATVNIDTTGAFSLDGAAASNISTTSADLTLSTITSGDLYMTSVGNLTFTDQYDSLTFAQVSAGMGNDLLNAGGEIYNATGTIGATIGGGETSTSLIHAINAVGTYAATIGAGANDDIDDVYNNGAAGTYIANVDASPTGYNVTSTDGDGFIVQDTGSTFANFNVDASGNPLIDFDPYDFTLDATNIFSIQAVGDSDITTTTGDLSLTAGDDMIFSDNQIGANIVQLSSTDSDWDTDFATVGIIDNINDLATLLGGDTISTFNFTEDNVLADDDAVYAALDKLDLKWGDLASTANSEGASLVGVEDVGNYFTGTDVEAVLQELGADVAIEVEDLIFYPEWPDAAVWADGTNNRGTLTSEYDSTQDTNHYNWTTTRATQQDINVQFMFVLPPDFSAVGANGLQFEYRTGAGGTGSNAVQLYMYERTGAGATTLCGNTALLSNGTGAGGAFATGQVTKATIDGGCTLTAGDVILIEAKFFDDNGAADFADVGYVTLDYTR